MLAQKIATCMTLYDIRTTVLYASVRNTIKFSWVEWRCSNFSINPSPEPLGPKTVICGYYFFSVKFCLNFLSFDHRTKTFLPRDAMHKLSAAIAVMRCPSVCPSVTFVDRVKTNKRILHFFNHRVATPF